MERNEKLFIFIAFTVQIVMVIYFGLRKWDYDLASEWGWVVYLLAFPTFLFSMEFVRCGESWTYWTGGILYGFWGVLGYSVDIVGGVEWRFPIYWPVFVPYLILYLAAIIFYWWPMENINRRLWYVYGCLILVSTYLNLTSQR